MTQSLDRTLDHDTQTKIKIGEIFNFIHHQMNMGINYEEILESVFTELDSIIPFDRIGIALLEQNNEVLATKWMKSKLPVKGVKPGYKAAMIGSSLCAILANESPRIIPDLREYFRENPQSDSTRLILKDGILSNLTCPLITGGRVIGFVFFSSSKTYTYNREHIEIFTAISQGIALIVEQALMKEKMMDIQTKEKVFRSTIHDLNNPLAIIKITLDMLERKDWFDELDDRAKSSFATLKRSSEAMIAMVTDLIQINNIKAGKNVINLSSCKLDEFLSEVLSDSLNMAKKKSIEVQLNVESNLPDEVHFDPLHIKRALENLISNAIKYSESKTLITIKVEAHENKLQFAVTDQGQGIPENEIGNLFKEFGKTSVKPTSGELSTGLGLANVKKIIEEHEGNVSVETKVNVGSTFSFWIPIKPVH